MFFKSKKMRTHQIIHFINGEKKTLFDIVGVKEGDILQAEQKKLDFFR